MLGPGSTMPHFLSDAEIEHIGRGLLDRSLPKVQWTHADHDMPRMIRAYNEATGVPNTDTSGYHETVTLGSLRAARAWMVSRPGVALYEALRQLLASEYGRPDWLLAYGRSRYCSRLLPEGLGSSRTCSSCHSEPSKDSEL